MTTTKPIVIYGESIKSQAGPFEGKLPNKHNHIQVTIETLQDEIVDMIKTGKVSEYGQTCNGQDPTRKKDGI